MSSKNPVRDNLSQSEYQGVRIIHEGFSWYDEKQKIVQYAYDIGGMDLVKLIECENGNWSPRAVGDNGKAYGLCQINTNYHKLDEGFFDDWKVQVEQCKRLKEGGTKFYGPDRIIKGVKCSKYIEDRFTFTE